MKKIATILTTALVISVCSTTALASCHRHGSHHAYADSNTICDNRGSHGCGGGCSGYIDASGDGICDNRGSHGCGRECSGYIDANGDGICDNTRYDIKYNLNGGKNSKKNPSSYCLTTKTIKLQNPVKSGYTFKGWYADKQCRKKVTAIKKGSVGKKTLYAKWKKN